MVQVCLWRDGRAQVCAYALVGHAGYAAHGKDIVCAAVSALAQTAANGLEAVAGLCPRVKARPGFLYVRIPEAEDEQKRRDGQVILLTLAQGLADISAAYPGQVKVIWKERRCDPCFK